MTSSVSSSPRRHIWRWILGILAVSSAILAICIANLVTLTRDAAALRRAVVTAGDLRPAWRVQASVGPLILGAIRGGLRFVPDVPAEAHDALAAVRSASVGVYQLKERPDARSREELLSAADTLMADRGWVRTVGVRDGEDTVMIFTPADASGAGPMRVCVAVCTGDELVVVDAKIKPAALAALVAKHEHKLARF